MKIRRTTLLACGLLAFMVGIGLARTKIRMDASLIWLALILLAVTFKKQNLTSLAVIIFFGILVGWWRGDVFLPKLAVHDSLHGSKVELIGTARDDAVYGRNGQLEYVLGNVQVVAPRHEHLTGTIIIRGFGEKAVYRGDTMLVSGKLFPTLGNNLSRMSFAQFEVIQRDSSLLNRLRRQFSAGMQSALPEPASSFGLGILIGQRSTMPERTQESLRHVGLTHIIAVSGYNLTVIVMACRRLLSGRSKFQATAACLGLLGVFLFITGSSPPIVRASIVSLLGIVAWYYGRSIKPLLLLFASAAITAAANPVYIWGNVSWYLSFLAFFGVLVLAPLVVKRLYGEREPKVLVGVLIESACATIMTLPYILYVFGEMSLVSLPANLLIIPLIPFGMVLALVAGVSGMLLPAVAGWFAWPANILLTYMLDVAVLFERIPRAFLSDLEFSLISMIVSYACITLWSLVLWHKTRQKHGIIGSLQPEHATARLR